MFKKSISVVLLAFILLTASVSSAFAVSDYKRKFNAKYKTSGTRIDSCKLCHTTAPSLNAYGKAFANHGYSFTAIEKLDSDKDGVSNGAEIKARTFPGNAKDKPKAVAKKKPAPKKKK